MFKVRLTPRNAGSTRNRKRMISEETFNNREAARRWIIQNMAEQEKTAWRQIGLVDVRRAENGDKFTMEIRPALRLYKGLVLTYEIMEV